MEQKAPSQPIKLNLTIESGSLKKVLEQGRLEEFVDTLSTLAAAHIRKAIVGQVAKGGGGAVSVLAGFDDDNPYYTGPRPPGPWPQYSGIFESAMRQLAVNEIVKKL